MILIIHSKPLKGSTKKQFRVQLTGKNNEILATSEPLKTKQAAWKNIHSMYENFPQVIDSALISVKDETLAKPEMFTYDLYLKAKAYL